MHWLCECFYGTITSLKIRGFFFIETDFGRIRPVVLLSSGRLAETVLEYSWSDLFYFICVRNSSVEAHINQRSTTNSPWLRSEFDATQAVLNKFVHGIGSSKPGDLVWSLDRLFCWGAKEWTVPGTDAKLNNDRSTWDRISLGFGHLELAPVVVLSITAYSCSDCSVSVWSLSINRLRTVITSGSPIRSAISLWDFVGGVHSANHATSCMRNTDPWWKPDRTFESFAGVFKIENSKRLARYWGARKNRPAMNYDKLSRSIRQYYKKGIMKKTDRSQRLVYQFCPGYAH